MMGFVSLNPSYELRNSRNKKCVWIEPVFQEHRLSTKQAEVMAEYLEAGFKIEIVPVRRMPREAMKSEAA